ETAEGADCARRSGRGDSVSEAADDVFGCLERDAGGRVRLLAHGPDLIRASAEPLWTSWYEVVAIPSVSDVVAPDRGGVGSNRWVARGRPRGSHMRTVALAGLLRDGEAFPLELRAALWSTSQ